MKIPHPWFWLPLAGGALADLGAKTAARALLVPGRPVGVLPGVRWDLVENPGASFGVALPAKGLVTLALVAAFACAWRFWETRRGEPATDGAYGLILGGALGNAWERWTAAGVTDYLRLDGLFVCNLGDILITAGCALLLWREFRAKPTA